LEELNMPKLSAESEAASIRIARNSTLRAAPVRQD
jgi:hypothetical protein